MLHVCEIDKITLAFVHFYADGEKYLELAEIAIVVQNLCRSGTC